MKFNKRYNCYVSNNGIVCRYNEKTDKLKVLSQSPCKHGSKYMRVSLHDEDGKLHSVKVHRLVYMTFIGDIPDGMQIDHIDGNALNNNLKNLRCVSPKENSNNPNTVWKLRGVNNGMYGRKHTEDSKLKMSNNKIGKYKGRPLKNSIWSQYNLSRSAIEEKLHLCRTKIEALHKQGKLKALLEV